MCARRSFGRVYQGWWRGGSVAIKVVSHEGDLGGKVGALRESLLCSNIQHPHVVRTYHLIKTADAPTNPATLVCASTPHAGKLCALHSCCWPWRGVLSGFTPPERSHLEILVHPSTPHCVMGEGHPIEDDGWCAQVTTYKVISSRKGTVQKMAPPGQASIPKGEQVILAPLPTQQVVHVDCSHCVTCVGFPPFVHGSAWEGHFAVPASQCIWHFFPLLREVECFFSTPLSMLQESRLLSWLCMPPCSCPE